VSLIAGTFLLNLNLDRRDSIVFRIDDRAPYPGVDRTAERDGYKNGYSEEKRRAWIFVQALLNTLESMVRRGGLEPPRDCSR
jgi:hypothetical protein